jgi:outer membrane protein assembly factor BamA
MLKKYVLILVALICLVTYANAQDSEKQKFWERVYFGGNFGLNFGTDYSVVEVSPLVGYRLTEKLSVGFGVTYIYYSVRNRYTNDKYESSIYGGNIFTRYFFLENLFAHVETGALNLDVPAMYYPYNLSRQWSQNLLVGGGYRSQIGERSSFTIMLLYDLIDDPNSPYRNPIFRVGFGFGI